VAIRATGCGEAPTRARIEGVLLAETRARPPAPPANRFVAAGIAAELRVPPLAPNPPVWPDSGAVPLCEMQGILPDDA
jgi:hypothetical protein